MKYKKYKLKLCFKYILVFSFYHHIYMFKGQFLKIKITYKFNIVFYIFIKEIQWCIV